MRKPARPKHDSKPQAGHPKSRVRYRYTLCAGANQVGPGTEYAAMHQCHSDEGGVVDGLQQHLDANQPPCKLCVALILDPAEIEPRREGLSVTFEHQEACIVLAGSHYSVDQVFDQRGTERIGLLRAIKAKVRDFTVALGQEFFCHVLTHRFSLHQFAVWDRHKSLTPIWH